MSKYPLISRQLWNLSVVEVMGLDLVMDHEKEVDGQSFLSGDLVLDLEVESLDYQDHRELFTGPGYMADIANCIEPWEDQPGAFAAHIESLESIRQELGWRPMTSVDSRPPESLLWDESWEQAASLETLAS